MHRYFFHLYESGTLIADDEGRELPDIEAVRRAATDAARDIMANEVRGGYLCLSCHIEVKDADDKVVLTVPFGKALTLSGL